MDVESRADVLFLTGQPGVGKSAVAREISELLWQVREPHAVIDLDELCRGFFPTQTAGFNRSLAVTNLKAIWANFHAAGVRRLILARIIESLDDIEQFSAAIPNAQVTVCFLHAAETTVEQRLTEREAGSARMFLLGVTNRIAEQMAGLNLPGIRIQNDERPLKEVACEILKLVDWRSPDKCS